MDENKPAEIVDISTLAGKFKNRAELQQYCEKLFLGLKQALEKINKLENENKHLQSLLDASVPELKISNEQAIAEIQLEKLKKTALERDLTLDETKRMDLLVKNLYLSKGKPTSVMKAGYKKIEDISDAELIELAKKDE